MTIMTTNKSTVISYDVDRDLKVITFLNECTNKRANITDLRTNTISNNITLDKHLANLEKWEMIKDEKPSGNGKARKITLIKPYDFCRFRLLMLKVSIDHVNNFFG